MLIGYVRVSTNDQNTDLQRNALVCAGYEQIFEDKLSGTRTGRPGLKRALKRLQKVTHWLSENWTDWFTVCGILSCWWWKPRKVSGVTEPC